METSLQQTASTEKLQVKITNYSIIETLDTVPVGKVIIYLISDLYDRSCFDILTSRNCKDTTYAKFTGQASCLSS